MWIKDPKTTKKSVSVTLLVLGYSVCLLKLLFADSKMGDFSMGGFTSSDFATIVGTLGALYAGRKYTDKDKEE